MRRFELSEGSSNKFWQIELTGDSFTVTFGKLGTVGQTQTKSFASGTAAQAEHDKLVKEKLKKGYAEITAAPAAAPVVAPKPAVVKSAPASAAPAAAPPPAIAAATAGPGSIVLPPGKADQVLLKRRPQPWEAKAKETFEKEFAGDYHMLIPLKDGLKHTTPHCGRLQQAVIANLESGKLKETLELEEEAALFALCGAYRDHCWDRPQSALMRLWIGHAGVEFALEAFVRSTAYNSQYVFSGGDGSYWLMEADPQRPRPFSNVEHGYDVLREYLLTADDANYARARAVAETLRNGASLTTRSFLSMAFIEETEWVHADLAEWPAMMADPVFQVSGYPAWGLASGATDGALVAAMLKAVSPTSAYIAQPLVQYQEAFAARAGASAEEALLLLAELVAAGNQPGTAVDVAKILAWMKSERVAHYFACHVGEKNLRALALEYLRSSPVLGLKGLAQAASGSGAQAATARTALAQLVTSLPEVEAHLPALSPASRAVVESLLAKSAVKQEANDAQLPRVLASPPWLTKAKPAPSQVVTGLTLLPREDRLDPEFKVEPGLYDHERDEERETRILEKLATATSPMPLIGDIGALPLPSVIHVLETGRLEPLEGYTSWFWIAASLLHRGGVAALNALVRYANLNLADVMQVFPYVDSPKVAPFMALAMATSKKSRTTGQEWLQKYPEAAAIGLLPVAVGPAGNERTAAEAAIRFLASRGHTALLLSVAEQYGAAAKTALRAVLDFDPLLLLPSKLPKMPGFWKPGAFSRPLLKDRQSALPLKAVEALGTMLAFTSEETPYAGLAQVREACDPASLAEFAWELFQAWLTEGAPSKEQWAFLALGHLGNDESARKLTPLLRAWPGEAAHARAVAGLEVLALIGTDVALMHLHGIAQKAKFKGLQEKAREKIAQLAEARGLSAEELADRLVPDLGLDDDGSLTLDFGSRSFRIAFDETLKPLVLDNSGKQLGELPKPNKSDDAEKSAAAVELWKALKKDAKAIATNQVLRLEVAMCSERKWAVDVFRNFLLDHPLMIHLVRRLVWGAYDDQGKLTATFRVAEDRSLADEQDSTFTLPETGSIGLPHRLALSEAQTAAWGQVFSDYKIIQPIEQLGRPVFLATEAERQSSELERLKDVEVPTGKVLGLESRGWRRGAPGDGGWVWEMEKPLSGGFLISLKLGGGIGMGYVAESPSEQKLGVATITYDSRSRYGEKATFGELSPVAFSELVMSLERLRG